METDYIYLAIIVIFNFKLDVDENPFNDSLKIQKLSVPGRS